MNDNEEAVLVCMSVADMPTPRVPSVAATCMRCDIPLWRSEGSLIHPIVGTICVQCAGEADEIGTAQMLPSVRADLLEAGWTIGQTEAAEQETAEIVRELARRRRD